MSTALVTGATAGIGRAFAVAFAGRGADLVLVARDGARLDGLARELTGTYGVDATPCVADLVDEHGLTTVEARLRDPEAPIDILVNNAGFGTYGDFSALDVATEEREIRLNVLALVRLTHAALGGMLARRTGAVLNISSLAAYQPSPSSATYGATKAFVNSFTHSVHQETRGTGVHVMLVCPGFTHTEFHDRAGLGPTGIPEFLWQSADEVVGAALRDLDRRRSVSIPGALNKTMGALSSVAPAGVSRRVAAAVIRRAG
ncbi:MAG TPA: SDR family oxidoreductase [Acidimicrobiia bacterium]|nr:SDR family oxidoreductase [Acidimicrobiia bacterium]